MLQQRMQNRACDSIPLSPFRQASKLQHTAQQKLLWYANPPKEQCPQTIIHVVLCFISLYERKAQFPVSVRRSVFTDGTSYHSVRTREPHSWEHGTSSWASTCSVLATPPHQTSVRPILSKRAREEVEYGPTAMPRSESRHFSPPKQGIHVRRSVIRAAAQQRPRRTCLPTPVSRDLS